MLPVKNKPNCRSEQMHTLLQQPQHLKLSSSPKPTLNPSSHPLLHILPSALCRVLQQVQPALHIHSLPQIEALLLRLLEVLLDGWSRQRRNHRLQSICLCAAAHIVHEHDVRLGGQARNIAVMVHPAGTQEG